MTDILIEVSATHMPTEWCRLHGVAHLGISRRAEVLDIVSTEESGARFRATVDVIDKPAGWDFRGPYVFGKPGERFLYLNWGSRTVHGWHSGNGGRIKLHLGFVSHADLEAAIAGGTLVAELTLCNEAGEPRFATVRAPALVWRLDDSRGHHV